MPRSPLLLLAAALAWPSLAAATDPATLLLQARAAIQAPAKPVVVELNGSKRARGLDGRWRRIVDLGGGDASETADYGLFATREVWRGSDHWRFGRSGAAHPINSAFARRTAVTDAWLARRAWLAPGAGGARLEAMPEVVETDAVYGVIRATPAGGEPVELWIDRRTGLLARTVQRLSVATRTIRYQDYRPTPAGLWPFGLSIDDGGRPDTVRVEAVRLLASSPAHAFDPPAPPADVSVAGGEVRVPIGFDGFVTVEARVNGKGPFAFILDTGGRAILTPAAAEAIGLNQAGAGESGGAGEGTVKVRYAKVDRLDIGGVSLRGLSFTILPYGYDTIERGALPPFAGLIGLELFERLAVRVDYAGRAMTMRPFGPRLACRGGRRAPIRFTDDMPLVEGALDGVPGDLAIDTGNPLPVVIQGVWATRQGIDGRLRQGLPLTGAGGVGGSFSLWASRADLELAGHPLPHVVGYFAEDRKGAFSSVSEAGILGNEVLAHFAIDFDYRRGEICLTPEPGFKAAPYDRAGLTVEKPSREVFVIDSVTPGGPAAEAGLKQGDRITAVDGRPASEMAGWDFGRAIRRAPGVRMALSVMREGKPQTVELTLRELLP